ncbi:MAG TPA: hypothetical protein VGK63_12310 [Candidatus Limnocylindrales bacterium]
MADGATRVGSTDAEADSDADAGGPDSLGRLAGAELSPPLATAAWVALALSRATFDPTGRVPGT